MRNTTYHRWTRPEERYIERNYLEMTDQQLAGVLKVTTMQVTGHRINALGLRKRKYYRKVA